MGRLELLHYSKHRGKVVRCADGVIQLQQGIGNNVIQNYILSAISGQFPGQLGPIFIVDQKGQISYCFQLFHALHNGHHGCAEFAASPAGTGPAGYDS